MMNKINFFCILFLVAGNCYALTCPTNFSIINIGDTLDSVKQTCGKPDSEKKTEEEKPQAQEWTYFMAETVSTGTSYSSNGTLKTSFSFDKDGNAINISVNGIGVGATTICGNNLNLGATRLQVKDACGEPAMINKQSSSGKQEMDTIVEITYNTTPPATLIFTNDTLSGSK